MDEKLKQATEICQKYGQEQLLDAYSRIKDEQDKQSFLDQILTIDFKQIEDIYEGKNVSSSKFNDANVEPIEFVDKYKLPKKEYEKYEKIGTEKIKAGKLAVVTMAGGQGTRLGHNGPKGTFDLGLDSHKSIFEILTDVLKEARKKYEVDIPWYIMTSEENDATTQEFFEENDFNRGSFLWWTRMERFLLMNTEKLKKHLMGMEGYSNHYVEMEFYLI